jgi:pimeloyl-ACP methyl ester carboxylesterase
VQPQRAEVRALAQLGFDEIGGAVAGIGAIHRAIADRVFGATGPGATPVRMAHDAVARRVYGGMRLGAGTIGRGAGAAAARVGIEPLSASPRGSVALSVLNGLIGDQLAREGSALDVGLTLRVAGPRTPRVAVFLHGLMETDGSWALGGRETYGARLAADLGYTPVYVRYNTGRHVSENGATLAAELGELLAGWPVAPESIALIGHSMGGLVARSACHQAAAADAEWVAQVRHVVSLGTPHMGAPLAQAAHWLSATLNALPESRALSAWLRRRSAGIRDLRQGSLVDEDWRDHDPEALRGVACGEVPLLPGATHCFVSATLTRDQDHPVARLLGDVLVLVPSASGRSRSRRLGFADEDGRHLGGTHHLALLNHPAVYEQLRAWLARP